ncbi:metallophosphoesterase family protein [Siminovitchia sp. 179-K 8D1 HS]|uniref:metallophosphoesterase family protein n=1 Tax=Siminovitchia sp. 179-K 8D1 HS TaxID=3142385 RepID=UPI0039A00374
MKIVVTSDTHNQNLPQKLISECESADLIIHAGDWSSMEVYRTLSSCAKVVGVHGNVDDNEIKEYLAPRDIIQIEGYKIGIVHGHGSKQMTEKRALEAFEGEGMDIIIFGHSHIPMMRYVNKVMLMNPGSPTDKRRMPYYSYGILHIDKTLRAEIVFFTG